VRVSSAKRRQPVRDSRDGAAVWIAPDSEAVPSGAAGSAPASL